MLQKLGIDDDKPVRSWREGFEPKQTSDDHCCESTVNSLQGSLAMLHDDSDCSDSIKFQYSFSVLNDGLMLELRDAIKNTNVNVGRS